MDGEVDLRSRGDVRRDAILRIARSAFLEDGYAATSMSAIAARLGGSKGTLYNYFRSKDELFVAFMREVCMKEADEAFSLEGYDGDIRAALHRVGVLFVRVCLSETVAAVHRLVIAEGTRFPELGRAFYEAGPRKSLRVMTAFFEREAGAGRLRTLDAARAASQFLELCKGGLNTRRLWTGEEVAPEEIDATVASAVTVFMAAYGPERG